MNTSSVIVGVLGLGADVSGANMNPIVLGIALFGMAVQTVGVLGIVRRDGFDRGEMNTTLKQLTLEVAGLRVGRDEDRAAREHLAEIVSGIAIQLSRVTAQVDTLFASRGAS